MRRGLSFWGALGLFIGLLILASLAAPRIEAVSPNSQSLHVSSSAPIRIAFSRRMDQVSVESRIAIRPPTPGQFSWQGNALTFQPSQPWPPGSSVQVSLSAGARSAFFLPILRSFSWSFQVGQPRLSYLWPADSVANLYIYDLAAGEAEQITQTVGGVLDYTVTAGAIVYAEQGSDGSTALYSLDLDRGAIETLYECSPSEHCSAPAVDPSGQLLAFERFEWQVSESGLRVPGPSEVWIMPLEGQAEPSALPPVGQSLKTPDWSPTGRLAFYNATLGAIGLTGVEQSAPPELYPNGLGLLGSWSPDGRYLVVPEIVFPERETTEFVSHLYRIDTLSTAVSELSQGPVEDASPSYSPDGQWIAFARKYLDQRWTPGRQLWLMLEDGTDPRPLTDQPDLSHSAISWSPDSTRLAYMRRSQTHSPQIWISDLSGEQQQMLIDGGYLPRWLP